MVQLFFKMNSLPENFDYNEYVRLTLMRNCCNLMSVHWSTWLLLSTLSVVGGLLRIFRKGVSDTDTFLLECIVINWVLLLLHIFVMLAAHRTQHQFLLILREAIRNHDKGMPNPFGENWSPRIKWYTQNCAVLNAFLTALFVMNVLYNLSGHSFTWFMLILGPLCFNFFVALPFIVSHVAFVEAFYVMDPDTMDAMLEDMDELETDMNYVRNRWHAGGRKDIKFEGEIDEKRLSEIFKEMGIHCSKARCKRIFRSFDSDGSGEITNQEFLEALKRPKDETPRDASAASQVSTAGDIPHAPP
jgi:hypothetical protein